MTARELRQILAAVEDQNMTIRTLRNVLYFIDYQDIELTEEKLARATKEGQE